MRTTEHLDFLAWFYHPRPSNSLEVTSEEKNYSTRGYTPAGRKQVLTKLRKTIEARHNISSH